MSPSAPELESLADVDALITIELAPAFRFLAGLRGTVSAFCYRLLDEAGVVMFPCNSFGDRWENWVRVSLLAPVESVREAIGRIGGFVAALDAS